MNESEIERLKAINAILLDALVQARQELTFIVEECADNNETHEGCEAAILAADIAIRATEPAGAEK